MADEAPTPNRPAQLAAAQERAQDISRQVVALHLHAANELAKRAGCRLRVVRRNGEGLVVTADLDPRRIDIEVEGDIVVDTLLG